MKTKKYLVFVSTQCAGAGEIGDFPVRALCDSEKAAQESFEAAQTSSRALIDRELAMIADPENKLIFDSGYTSSAAIFEVPGSSETAEDAEDWISEQLDEGEEVSEHVLRFEGICIEPEGETEVTVEDFLESWC